MFVFKLRFICRSHRGCLSSLLSSLSSSSLSLPPPLFDINTISKKLSRKSREGWVLFLVNKINARKRSKNILPPLFCDSPGSCRYPYHCFENRSHFWMSQTGAVSHLQNERRTTVNFQRSRRPTTSTDFPLNSSFRRVPTRADSSWVSEDGSKCAIANATQILAVVTKFVLFHNEPGVPVTTLHLSLLYPPSNFASVILRILKIQTWI